MLTTAHISKHNDLLLLDYDGVVADSLTAIREHTAAFCRERGLGQGLASAAIACMRSATLAGLIEAAGITGEHVREYGRYLFRELNKNPSRVPLFDGIPELLSPISPRAIRSVSYPQTTRLLSGSGLNRPAWSI
ncbi:MAG: hypothetical protein Ct9H300mP16_10000 [Pseudomonadota bacterium]|nr:MAG: hypothetical protein Ct9H300mP16_10000 [Pseudomonadota bacterium]